jgi:hypothetical protein
VSIASCPSFSAIFTIVCHSLSIAEYQEGAFNSFFIISALLHSHVTLSVCCHQCFLSLAQSFLFFLASFAAALSFAFCTLSKDSL